jgi:DNA polymerase
MAGDLIKTHLDFETYSEADLTQIGAYAYAAHPTTDVLCASYAIGKSKVRRWLPGDACPFDNLDVDDIEIHAWNSGFERLIWREIMVPRYGWPRLRLTQFVCVSAQARITAAGPAKLDTAGRFFGQTHKKDRQGHLHMLKMCRPASEKEQIAYEYENQASFHREFLQRCHHTPENIEKLAAYCDQDVRTERDIAAILPEWRDEDLVSFWDSERINDHGIVVDTDFARAATAYAEDEKAYFNERLAEITGNVVTTPRQFQKIKEWALPRMCAEAVEITEHYAYGVKKNTFDADTRSNLLTEYATDPEFLDEDVAEFIEILDLAGKSTISKYQAIANRSIADLTDDNPRVHGSYMFAGASQSGRFSSTGIQLHNLVRKVPGDTVAVIRAFKRADRRSVEAFGKPIHLLSQLVRPAITGCHGGDFDLVWADWSAIEARALPWLSLHPDADERLALFRRGDDVYCYTASKIFGRKITPDDKDERQIGKVAELSLGYLGGVGAFGAMAKNYGVRLPERQILDIIKVWRNENSWAVGFGDALEAAAKNAILYPGSSYSAGRISYRFDAQALGGMGALFARLPSGRELCYPEARLDVIRTKWGEDKATVTARKSAWQPKQGEEAWPRVALWRGLLAENVTQAACADLLMLALRRARKAGLAVCAHTHDEIMIESTDLERDAPLLARAMTDRPPWPGADMLPLNVEVGWGYRYKVDVSKEEKRKAA